MTTDDSTQRVARAWQACPNAALIDHDVDVARRILDELASDGLTAEELEEAELLFATLSRRRVRPERWT